MAKIALLFSGQIRDINPSLFNEGLRIFTKYHTADIYLSYWDTAGKSGNHSRKILENNSIKNFDIQKYLKIAFKGYDIKKEKIVKVKDWEHAENSEIKEINNNKNFHFTTVNSAKQLFQIYNSYLLLENPNEYDFIVRCRFDNVFVFPFSPDLNCSENYLANINFGKAFKDDRVYDIFFYTKSSSSNPIFTSWLKFAEYVRYPFDNLLDPRDAGRILYLSALLNNIKVKSVDIRYCDVFRRQRKFGYFFDLVKWGLARTDTKKKYIFKNCLFEFLILFFKQFIRF
ncbi:hypothetical protein OAO38_04735 [Candidatus Pelagibacter ubique]|nr:hypothetical protein [Candidatus Pelagibacter ubique]